MKTDPNNPRGVTPSPDGIIRDRKWWIAILTVSATIAQQSGIQTPEATFVGGIWYPHPIRPILPEKSST